MTSESEPEAKATPEKAKPKATFNPIYKLSDEASRTYSLEQYPNNRLLFRLLAVRSSVALTPAEHLASPSLVSYIARTGQFAEVSNGGIVDPAWLWSNLGMLVKEGGALEGYEALLGSELVEGFRGSVAGLRAIVLRRNGGDEEGGEGKGVIVSFSGTESFKQAMHDMDARFVKWGFPGEIEMALDLEEAENEKDGARRQKRFKGRVHAGFWHILQGLLRPLSSALEKAFSTFNEDDGAPTLTITGHSLGAALTFLFALHILTHALLPDTSELRSSSREKEEESPTTSSPIVRIPPGTRIRVVGYGTPRVGDKGLASAFQALVGAYRARFGADAFEEYSVKAYRDGTSRCLL